MLLCLDVGNSQVYGGVFIGSKLQLRFRHSTQETASADQLGIFLKNVIRENKLDPSQIEAIAICSVVPNFDYALRHACMKYLDRNPFILKAGIKTGLNIKYHSPIDVGADRIANAIAVIEQFPKKNRVVVDFGTATTFCAIDQNNAYLGGIIMPGFRLSMQALQTHTAKLPSVEIVKPQRIIGQSTQESLQIGLYQSQFSAIKAIHSQINTDYFSKLPALLIGTGGFAYLFAKENLFTVIEPDLVLIGLRLAYFRNC